MLKKLRLMTAGESHGPALCAILDGIPAGLPLSCGDLAPDLARRQGLHQSVPYVGASARMRIEQDGVKILGGVMAGRTTGAPIALEIENADHARWKGKTVSPIAVPRPGHADLVGAIKYGYDDLRLSLERASARETAARVAAGSVCRRFLAEFGVQVGSYVVEIGGVGCSIEDASPDARLAAADLSPLRCPDPVATQAMEERIREVAAAHESAGGVFEVVALGVPAGLGSYMTWEERLSARLAAAVMSVPAIKGVEFGEAFALAAAVGSDAHDHVRMGTDGETVVRPTNHAAGLEGGVTTGQPIVIRAAMKPLATTVKPQPSVDLASGTNAESAYQRSDICAVPRAAVVAEAMVCLLLADALLEKLGGDSLDEMRPRFHALRRARSSELRMRTDATVYWE